MTIRVRQEIGLPVTRPISITCCGEMIIPLMCLINPSLLQEKDGQTAKPSTTRVRPVIEFPANLRGLDSVARHPGIQKI